MSSRLNPPPPPGAPGTPEIPSYDEAIASSSRSEIESEQRHGLLRSSTPTTSNPNPNLRNGNYRPPRAESVRSSMSSDFLESEYTTPRGSREDLRREMQILEVEDPLHTPSGGAGSSAKGLQRTSKIAKSILRRLESIGTRIRNGYSAFTPFHGLRYRLSESCPNPLNAIPEQFTNGTYTPLYRLMGIIVVMIVIYILMASEIFTIRRPAPKQDFTRTSVREFVLTELKEGTEELIKWERHVASFDHIAGTKGDYTLVEWVHQWFNTFRMDTVGIERFDVYLSFAAPDGGGRTVEIVSPEGMKWKAELEEKVVDEGQKGKGRPGIGAYHAFAKDGDVTGHLVYAGEGTKEDYDRLEKAGVVIKDAVVLVRRDGGVDLSWKIKIAAERGAVGLLSYRNPLRPEDVQDTKEDRMKVQPLEDYVIREAVGTLITPGDVLTPGFAADSMAARLDPKKSTELPKIPSLPLSFKAAKQLLKSLEKHGKLQEEKTPWSDKFKADWFYEDYNRWTGSNNTDSPRVRLNNKLITKTQPIWNVMTTIQGVEQSEKKIIIGAQRSAWCFGAQSGASGTAILLEIARVFGAMYNYGWRPLRTIEFVSWDASESGSIGAIEHVEANRDQIRMNAYAYINLSNAISGTSFTAAGHPALHAMLRSILQFIPDPATSKAIYQTWPHRDLSTFPMLAGAGDYLPFQSHAGVFSIDLGFKGGIDLRGSCHDTHNFLKNHVERSDYRYHRTLAEIVSLLILELADTQQATISLSDYASYLHLKLTEFETWLHSSPATNNYEFKSKLNLKPLREALDAMTDNTRAFEITPPTWQSNGDNWEWESQSDRLHRMSHNGRIANFERHLLDLKGGDEGTGGLKGRQWYKHTIVAPDMENKEVPIFFPHIREAVLRGENAQKEIDHVADIISKAAHKLIN